MKFDSDYSALVGRFAHHLANNPNMIFVAPGESATDMTLALNSLAAIECLCLPTILTLNHIEAGTLYFASENCGELIKPAISQGNPRVVNIIEDFYQNGTKLRLINTALRLRFGIESHFTVMVGTFPLNLPFVETFEVNESLASELYRKYNKRK